MSKFDYSKWDNIELSDDESDLHPNIDKDSWFRLKHRTRLERESKEDEEVKKFEKLNHDDISRLSILNARLENYKKGILEDEIDSDALEGEIKEISASIASRRKYIIEVQERRKWNIDNICKVTEEKTIIGSKVTQSLKADDFKPTGQTESLNTISKEQVASSSEPTVSVVANVVGDVKVKHSDSSVVGPANVSPSRERFAVISYNDFVLAHEEQLENYSEIQSIEETKDYLFKNCDILLHEHSQSYMLLSCLEDEMNGKKERSKLVCRQSQILSHIHELGLSMHRDPRDVILPFFKRIEEKTFFSAFSDACNDFRKKIEARAIVKRKEMDEEAKTSQLGPGGLDPSEVFESLPLDVQEAFESQSVEKLQEVLSKMSHADAKDIMERCVASGLWVPKE